MNFDPQRIRIVTGSDLRNKVMIGLLLLYLINAAAPDTKGDESANHLPNIAPLAWARIAHEFGFSGLGTVRVTILNDEFVVLVTYYDLDKETSPHQDFRTSVWRLGNRDSAATVLHRSVIIPDAVFPVCNGKKVLYWSQDDLKLWDFDQRRIQLVGALPPEDVPQPASLPRVIASASTCEKSQLIAFTDAADYVCLARYDAVCSFVPSPCFAEHLFLNPDGSQLITINSDEVQVRPIYAEQLSVGPPRLTFRQLVNGTTREVAKGTEPLEIPPGVPESRGMMDCSYPLYDRSHAVIFDHDRFFLRSTVRAAVVTESIATTGLPHRIGFESWVVTRDGRCRLVRYDPLTHPALGSRIASLSTKSTPGKHTWPHFLDVYSNCLVIVPVSMNEFNPKPPNDGIIRFPKVIEGFGDLGTVQSAGINATGTQIVTAHVDGKIVVWSYQY